MAVRILVEKDSSTKVVKEVNTYEEAKAIEANGVVVQVLDDEDNARPLSEFTPPDQEEDPDAKEENRPVKKTRKKS